MHSAHRQSFCSYTAARRLRSVVGWPCQQRRFARRGSTVPNGFFRGPLLPGVSDGLSAPQLSDDLGSESGRRQAMDPAPAVPLASTDAAGHSDPGGRSPSVTLPQTVAAQRPHRPTQRQAQQGQWVGRAAVMVMAAATTMGLLAGAANADAAAATAVAVAAAVRDSAAVTTTVPYVGRTGAAATGPRVQRIAESLAARDIAAADEDATFTDLRFSLGLTAAPGAAGAPFSVVPTVSRTGSGAPGDVPGRGVAGVSESGEVASETEDRLLEAARQVEARVERVLGALVGGVPQLMARPDASEEVARNTATAHALIREVWEVVDANYLDARATGFDRQRWAELRDAALAVPYRDTASGYRAIRDLLARGLSDPYCRFIGPSELDAMKKYDVSGVGLNLGTATEYIVKTGNALPAPRDPSDGDGVYVVGVSKGSTADVAGIRQGDELLAIQGEPLDELTPFRAAGLISGAVQQQEEEAGPSSGQKSGQAGDVVLVRVRHASGEEDEVSIVRPRRTLPSTVTTSITRSVVQLPGGGRGEEVVGTVRLAAFNARAQSDMSAAIRQLEAAGATRLVLDLRDNRGGLVAEGLEVSRLFLDGDAPIVITERREAPPDTPLAPGPRLTAAPLLVLVNGHTASASEIVAGALRDNCRAVLAGSRTYGKGLIQSVYELSDGSGLVITVGKYLTPRGTDIDRYGIKPDFSSVPSGAQYDSTVKACQLAGAPLVYGRTP